MGAEGSRPLLDCRPEHEGAVEARERASAVLPATLPGTAVRAGRRHFFLAYTSPEFVLEID